MEMVFLKGADVSSLQAMEDYGAKYFDFDGEQKDALAILKGHGVNCIRLRIWNRPTTSFDKGDYCNLRSTIPMAKRIHAQDLKLLLDFHYSDTWADWKNQKIPYEWAHMGKEELAEAIYQYTREVLETLYQEGAYPQIVQLGNEIGHGILGEYGALEHPENMVLFLNRAMDAVLEADTGNERAKVMLHVESGGETEKTESFFTLLQKHGLGTFDYVGLSYYPYWAGSYDRMLRNLRNIHKKLGKPVIIVETAFPYTDESHDDRPNIVTGQLTMESMGLMPSAHSQYQVLEDMIRMVRKEAGGYGVFYWEPVWYCLKGVGCMKGLGNEWENQALFDQAGHALDGLKAFEI